MSMGVGEEFDRWEPHISRQPPVSGGRRRVGQASWSASVELSAGRLLAAGLFIVGGMSRAPSFWLPVAGSALVVGLVAAGLRYRGRAEDAGEADEVCWLADAAALGLVMPLLLANAFAASGDSAMRPAEVSVYLQTAAAATLALALLFAAISRRVRGDRLLSAIAFLPAALIVPALAEAHRDLRDATVASSLALAWLLAAVVSVVARRTGGPIGRLLPALSFAAFIVILLLNDPTFATFGRRQLPAALVEPLLILACWLALLLGALMPGEPAPPHSRRRRRPEAE